jgi:hypothetical protein
MFENFVDLNPSISIASFSLLRVNVPAVIAVTQCSPTLETSAAHFNQRARIFYPRRRL